MSAVAKAFWSAEDDARVKDLIGAGSSFRDVATALGKTRNAVAGRVQRLGLCHKTPRSNLPTDARPRPDKVVILKSQQLKYERPVATNLNTREELADPSVRIEGVFLVDLRINQCRWPVGDRDGSQTFCASPCTSGIPWCGAHQLRAYQPRTRK